METKVITLDNVKVTYHIPKEKIVREVAEGMKVVFSAGCLVFCAYILAMIFYALS